MVKIYEGNFKHKVKNSFGILYGKSGKTYNWEFINDIQNGKSVLFYPNSKKFQEYFYKKVPNDKGSLINCDKGTKREINYKNWNIIEKGEIYYYKRSKYIKIYKKKLVEFQKKCKNLGYEKFYNLNTEEEFLLVIIEKCFIQDIFLIMKKMVWNKNGKGTLFDKD